MVVKQVSSDVIDVFYGKGWHNWCRFEIIKAHNRRYLHNLNGNKLPEKEMAEIRNTFIKGVKHG